MEPQVITLLTDSYSAIPTDNRLSVVRDTASLSNSSFDPQKTRDEVFIPRLLCC